MLMTDSFKKKDNKAERKLKCSPQMKDRKETVVERCEYTNEY